MATVVNNFVLRIKDMIDGCVMSVIDKYECLNGCVENGRIECRPDQNEGPEKAEMHPSDDFSTENILKRSEKEEPELKVYIKSRKARAQQILPDSTSASSSTSFDPSIKETESGNWLYDDSPSISSPTAGSEPSRWDLKVFTFKELSKATSKFSPEYLLGEGGFGQVFKGFMAESQLRAGDRNGGRGADRVPIAIKKLNPNSFQGQQEWLTEIIILSNLRHPNLIQLYGYCSEEGEGLLVYEFMGRGSLDYHLFADLQGVESEPPIPWRVRLKIALEAATGLAFLHKQNIIHRDFKAANVLVDEHWNSKIADFGLSKNIDSDQSHISTRILGTLGYLDPNYIETAQLTKKSDVYAFGVLLLELLTGRRAAESVNDEEPRLTTWVQKNLTRKQETVLDLLDKRLHDELQTKLARRIAYKLAVAAKHCIEDDPSLRPTMNDMVDTLTALTRAEDTIHH